MRIAPMIALLVLLAALINAPCAPAQAVLAPRIVDKIDETQLLALKDNTLPVANSQNDRGQVRSDLPMTDLVLVLGRSPEQQAAFDAFVDGQYNPSSPNFHHWLSPAEVGEQFGPAASD